MKHEKRSENDFLGHLKIHERKGRFKCKCNNSTQTAAKIVALSIGKDFSGFAFDEFFHGSN